MPTLYHIKPKGDGYHILGCTLAGKFFLIDKSTNTINPKGKLIFKNIEDAQKFIAKYDLTKQYEPEKFWYSEEVYTDEDNIKMENFINKINVKFETVISCPDCGHSLRCMITTGADKTKSKMSESLYHCENNNCANDFNIVRDADGRFVKMTRHFWG